MPGIFAHSPERDACGIGGIALRDPVQKRTVVSRAMEALSKLRHRGGSVCRSNDSMNPGISDYDGDGTGILLQIPRAFFLREAEKINPYLSIQNPSDLALGVFFYLGREKEAYFRTRDEIEHELRSEGFFVVGWREVPVNEGLITKTNRALMPKIDHLIIMRKGGPRDVFEKRLYNVRKKLRRDFKRDRREIYMASLSSRTMVYKGRLTSDQFIEFYPDLLDERFETGMIIFHHRFSTNTYPHWYLAQPFRMLCHNGEINTIRANRNAIFAYYNQLKSLEPPVVSHEESDSSTLDHWLEEQMNVGGQSLLLSLRLTFPPAWERESDLSPDERHWFEFYKSQKAGLGIWDGPAGILAMDGDVMVAGVDRMGLRPVRWGVDGEGTFYASTETGSFGIPERELKQHCQLGPGEMVALDQKSGRLILNHEIVPEIHRGIGSCSLTFPEELRRLEDEGFSPSGIPGGLKGIASLDQLLVIHAWTRERVGSVLSMAGNGTEPIASTGFDRPLAIFSAHHPSIFKYFHQNFAQVTNPAIDPIREGSAMDLSVYLGEKVSSFSSDYRYSHQMYKLESPVLTPEMFGRILGLPDFRPRTFGLFFGEPEELTCEKKDFDETQYWGMRLKNTIHQLMDEVSRAVERGCRMVVLSHAGYSLDKGFPIPSLLTLAAVNEKLRRTGMRDKLDLVVEGGDIQEGHDIAALIGFGADAVYPSMIYETLPARGSEAGIREMKNLVQALDANLKKVMSKMGITTFYGYQDSKLMEAVGLNSEVMRFFGKPALAMEGLGMGDLAVDIVARVRGSIHQNKLSASREPRAYNPRVARALNRAARTNGHEEFQKFTGLVDGRDPITMRDLLEVRHARVEQVDAEEVESPEEIIRKYFRGAAMSHGALKRSVHQDIARAFNSFNAFSNSGEGGEDPDRGRNGKLSDARSRIRQVASGRFGVDAVFLSNADEIHIKIAQGSKPGEGGHLPARKVNREIAKNRHTQPGIGLISPPPHHDIYSIEDLTQLIYDLKSVNPGARTSVKLTAGSVVGIIAVGVAKAGADIIEIDGFDGGTGASLASSIEHAGLPLEIGLADVHAALVENGLRAAVKIRVGGGIKTATDVIKLALLGADEFSFGTALMIAAGCIMCRKCHIPDCSTGITSDQKPYKGNVRHIRNYLLYVAEGVRDKLSGMGRVSLRKIVGRPGSLVQKAAPRLPRANKLDLRVLFPAPGPRGKIFLSNSRMMNREIQESSINRELLDEAWETLKEGASRELTIKKALTNTDRSVGATLAGMIAARYGRKGFPGRITCRFQGQAGQSFGAFMVNGMKLILEGTSEDGAGKGMSGGRLIIRGSGTRPQNLPHQSLAGNNVCYGATGGECFIGGNVGQRLGIRNSGATIVTKGAGKYACEYMTGGTVVVVGEVGPEVGAGMSSGVGYFQDPGNRLKEKIYKTSVTVHPCDPSDFQVLLEILKKFHTAVKTDYVQRILLSWEEERRFFKKVLPIRPGS